MVRAKKTAIKPSERVSLFSQLTLYRYRYIIGYAVFAAALLFLVLFNFPNLPSGLSQGEIDSAASASMLDWSSFRDGTVAATDLPFHLMQKISLKLFGPTMFALRLPTVILALLAGVVLERLLKRLFHENVAIVSTIIAISTILFLTVAHSGSPMVMNIFLTTTILYLLVRILHGDKAQPVWVILLAIAVVLGLYSPMFSVLIFLALLLLFHPKARARIRKMPKAHLIVTAAVVVPFLVPLVLGLSLNGLETLKSLIGFGTWRGLTDNVGAMAGILFGINAGGTVSEFVPPVINMASLAVALIGLIRLFMSLKSARSYLLLLWLIVLVPILLFNTSAIPLTFVPFTILTAMGVDGLITGWNRYFPINPYARIAGLIPIFVLMFGIAYTTAQRYMLANVYEANVVTAHNLTLPAIMNEVQAGADVKVLIGESESQIADIFKNRAEVKTSGFSNDGRLIVTPEAYHEHESELNSWRLRRIETSQLQNDSVILRIYEK
ncbi:MAG: glycosyltransferase family 39 protein [Candidatus Nomurabacteria bacterium]|jgi:hypothetical protein|nr:glycosyltransferase family 39 protein [Candidatus Nomurabacteria bacterium]